MAVTYLLQKDYKGFATVTGDKVNSAGYNLEVSRNFKELFASLHNSNFTLDYCKIKTSVYREKKHPYDCFTNLSEDKSIPMTALWCPAFSNHG